MQDYQRIAFLIKQLKLSFHFTVQQGQNVIARQSQQAPGQSFDYPSVQDIQQGVNDAVQAQNPFYITEVIIFFPINNSQP